MMCTVFGAHLFQGLNYLFGYQVLITDTDHLFDIFNQVFNENLVIVMLKSAAGGWVGVRAGVNFWFPLNNFSLLWPIDTKLGVKLAYIKRQLGIATQVSVIKQGQGHCY